MHKVIRMLAIVLALLTVSDLAFAQRRGGGGRGGGMRGGGFRGGGFSGRAAARPNINRSMPRANVNRPTQRPSVDRGNLNTGNINRARINTGDRNRVGNINNIDRNVNIDRDWDAGWNWGSDGCCYNNHPIARGAAWGAAAAVTAAAIGSTVYALPSTCTTTIVDGISYYSCDGSWYQPQFVGTTVEYVVVSPPQ